MAKYCFLRACTHLDLQCLVVNTEHSQSWDFQNVIYLYSINDKFVPIPIIVKTKLFKISNNFKDSRKKKVFSFLICPFQIVSLFSCLSETPCIMVFFFFIIIILVSNSCLPENIFSFFLKPRILMFILC